MRARSPTQSPSAREALDVRITEASPDWPADRLGTLERNILRIGVYELEEETVPREVAINEAVVLAKRYASEDAARLVNGVLGRIAREEAADDAGATTLSLAQRSCSGRSTRSARSSSDSPRPRTWTATPRSTLIGELAELARQIEAELTRARGLADAAG